MPQPRLNLLLVDGRLGTAWSWHAHGHTFLRHEAELTADAVQLATRTPAPLRTAEPAADIRQALRQLQLASTRSYPDDGITAFTKLALAVWDEATETGYLARLGGIRRATVTRSPGTLSIHADHALAPICRMGAFAVALDRILTRYGHQADPGPPADRAIPAQRVPVSAH